MANKNLVPQNDPYKNRVVPVESNGTSRGHIYNSFVPHLDIQVEYYLWRTPATICCVQNHLVRTIVTLNRSPRLGPAFRGPCCTCPGDALGFRVQCARKAQDPQASQG